MEVCSIRLKNLTHYQTNYAKVKFCADLKIAMCLNLKLFSNRNVKIITQFQTKTITNQFQTKIARNDKHYPLNSAGHTIECLLQTWLVPMRLAIVELKHCLLLLQHRVQINNCRCCLLNPEIYSIIGQVAEVHILKVMSAVQLINCIEASTSLQYGSCSQLISIV